MDVEHLGAPANAEDRHSQFTGSTKESVLEGIAKIFRVLGVGTSLVAIACRIDIGTTGNDEAIKSLQERCCLMRGEGLRRNHHGQATSTSHGFDVLSGQHR